MNTTTKLWLSLFIIVHTTILYTQDEVPPLSTRLKIYGKCLLMMSSDQERKTIGGTIVKDGLTAVVYTAGAYGCFRLGRFFVSTSEKDMKQSRFKKKQQSMGEFTDIKGIPVGIQRAENDTTLVFTVKNNDTRQALAIETYPEVQQFAIDLQEKNADQAIYVKIYNNNNNVTLMRSYQLSKAKGTEKYLFIMATKPFRGRRGGQKKTTPVSHDQNNKLAERLDADNKQENQ